MGCHSTNRASSIFHVRSLVWLNVGFTEAVPTVPPQKATRFRTGRMCCDFGNNQIVHASMHVPSSDVDGRPSYAFACSVCCMLSSASSVDLPVIAFLTAFGTADHAAEIEPGIRIRLPPVTLTHGCYPHGRCFFVRPD